MIDLNARPLPSEDGKSHINTHAKGSTQLGKILSLPYETGEAIRHPILGSFRTVENLWCYLNTGGNRDTLRTAEPHVARNITRLAPKYSCDRFKDAIIDATILKLQSNSMYEQMMIDNMLPFDHYFLHGRDRVTIRPGNALIYISILNTVQEILRGTREHKFVRFIDMNFTPL